MRRVLLVLVASALVFPAQSFARMKSRTGHATMFQAAKTGATSPMNITRNAALVHAAVFDAVNGVNPTVPVHPRRARCGRDRWRLGARGGRASGVCDSDQAATPHKRLRSARSEPRRWRELPRARRRSTRAWRGEIPWPMPSGTPNSPMDSALCPRRTREATRSANGDRSRRREPTAPVCSFPRCDRGC